MRHSKWVVLTLLALVFAVLFGSVPALGVHEKPTEIHGVISTTLTITEDSKLTGDVVCEQLDNGPCIRFGGPNIKLSLNGFTMTGLANDPPGTNCVDAVSFPEADGIESKFDEVQIEGPGLVQRMRRHGIGLLGTSTDPVEKAQVKKITSHQNCFSGIFMGSVNNTLVEEVVSARNTAASSFRPCGGVCVTNSNNNRVRRSEFAGNGTIALGPPPAAIPNDFGIGLVGSSSGNIIEENGIGGNINGILLFPATANNLIRKNVIVGNPPIQVEASSTLELVGVDIHDFSAPGSNTFEENLCITYTGGHTPPPCPSIPQYAGHQNN
jgi:parallel beta-helix repeat protein